MSKESPTRTGSMAGSIAPTSPLSQEESPSETPSTPSQVCEDGSESVPIRSESLDESVSQLPAEQKESSDTSSSESGDSMPVESGEIEASIVQHHAEKADSDPSPSQEHEAEMEPVPIDTASFGPAPSMGGNRPQRLADQAFMAAARGALHPQPVPLVMHEPHVEQPRARIIIVQQGQAPPHPRPVDIPPPPPAQRPRIAPRNEPRFRRDFTTFMWWIAGSSVAAATVGGIVGYYTDSWPSGALTSAGLFMPGVALGASHALIQRHRMRRQRRR